MPKPHLTVTEDQQLTRTKIKKYFLYIFASLVLVVSFFCFELFPDFSEKYFEAEKQALAAKKNNTVALTKVKNYAKGTPVYEEYLKANKQKKEVFKYYKSVIKDEKFFGFRSIHFFMSKFGCWFGILIYSMFMLFRSYYLERKNFGMKVLHGLMIFTALFYLGWVFQVNQDYSKATYYLMTIFSAFMIVLAVSWITKYKEHNQKKLKKYIYDISKVALLNSKPEKRKEVLEVVKKITKGETV